MIQIVDKECFFQDFRDSMFYVGFLKSSQAWFPLCLVSDANKTECLDTLFLSSSQQLMGETVDRYVQHVPQAERTFVQYLTREEIRNLMQQYSLQHVAVIAVETDLSGCACGCGCGQSL